MEQDSVLVVALDEAKASANALGHSRVAADLKLRIDAVEKALSNLTAPREKAAVVRLALQALALRDEASVLYRQAGRTRDAVLEMMD